MFAENVTHFARVLRRAGVPVGPDRVITALEALEAVGFSHRDDVHAALSAVMLDRHEQQAIFDQVFDAFWRDPKLLEQMMALLLPKIQGKGERDRAKRAHRVADALAPPRIEAVNKPDAGSDDQIDYETSFTFSDRERLQGADFESMTAAEFELAKRIAEELPLPLAPVRRRRHEASG
ncbi:MAG: VWA domain-containing protein, partial [Rhizobiales bacterium]|nr:VWA domain-containing protein [Rhizobacter sp.]